MAKEEIPIPEPEEKKESKEEIKDRYVVTEVPTQTDLAIVDSKTGDVYNVLTILAKIANDLEEIKKFLQG